MADIMQEIVKETTEFMSRVIDNLEKQASFSDQWNRASVEIVDALARAGILEPHLKEAKVRHLQADPLAVKDILVKVASAYKPAAIGAPASVPSVSDKTSARELFAHRVMQSHRS